MIILFNLKGDLAIFVQDMMIFCVFFQLDRMESKLNDKVYKLQGCQEKKLQLEEKVQRVQPQLRDMKNTLEKYVNSMTVQQSYFFFFFIYH